MSTNYTIIIDKWERHEDNVRLLYRALLTGEKSTFNRFIEKSKDDWETETEVPAPELIQNATEKYNNMVAAKYWNKTYSKDAKTYCTENLFI